jgi:hypothetical protein
MLMNRHIVVWIFCGGVSCLALMTLAWWDPARGGTVAQMLAALAALIAASSSLASQKRRPNRSKTRRNRCRRRARNRR